MKISGFAAALVLVVTGFVAVPATASARPAPPVAAAPAAGPGITASAGGVVRADAPLPGAARAAAPLAQDLIPGTVRLAPDRTNFRIAAEPLDTPLMASKLQAQLGSVNEPRMNIGVPHHADVNGDGVPDLLVAVSTDSDNRDRGWIAVMRGLGDGRFTDPDFVAVNPADHDGQVRDFVVADVNGDGHDDLVVSVAKAVYGVHPGVGYLSLVLNHGDGTFDAPQWSNEVADPGNIFLGRWGGTTAVQLLTIEYHTMHVVDVSATGFDDVGPAGGVVVALGGWVSSGVVGDANGDGFDELYVAGNGTNLQQITHPLDDPTAHLVRVPANLDAAARLGLGDFDGDGKLDLVVEGRRSGIGVIQVLPLDPGVPIPPATFQTDYLTFDRGPSAGNLAVADVNHDGFDDVIEPALNSAVESVAVLRSDGLGGFAGRSFARLPGADPAMEPYGSNYGNTASNLRVLRGYDVFDADGNGTLDVAWAGDAPYNYWQNWGGAAIVLGDPTDPGALAAPEIFDAGAPYGTSYAAAAHAAVGDWDGDGHKDVVVLRDNSLAVLKGDGHGHLAPAQQIAARTADWCAPDGNFGELKLADIDGDGHLDALCFRPGSVGIAWGAGNDPVTTTKVEDGLPLTYSFQGEYVADLDGDGRLDLVVPIHQGDGTFRAYVWRQGAARTFVRDAVLPNLGNTPVVAVADVDGDGKAEVVSRPSQVNDGTTTIVDQRTTVWSDDGGASLTPHATVVSDPYQPYAIALGDVNGDNRLDLVEGTLSGGNRVITRLGDGHGGFATTATASSKAQSGPLGSNFQGPGTTAFRLADMDGDGNLDLVTAASGFGIGIGPGDGAGHFDASHNGRFNPGYCEVGNFDLGDLDGDGRPDVLATPNNGYPYTGPQWKLGVLLNKSFPLVAGPPDLAVTDVTVPAHVTAGDDLAVTVTVTNDGGDLGASADWTDAAWLGAPGGAIADASVVATQRHSGPLRSGESYTVTLTGPATARAAGTGQVTVRTDAQRELSDANRADNEATRTVDVQVPTIEPGGAGTDVHVAAGHTRLVRVTAAAGQTFTVQAQPTTPGTVKGRLGADVAPGVGAGTALRTRTDGSLVASATRSGAGDEYLVLTGLESAGDTPGTVVHVAATVASMAVFGSTPTKVDTASTATLTITGAGLDGATFALRPAAGATGGAVTARTVEPGDKSGEWRATFDLGARLGRFDLAATGTGGEAVLPGAVTVSVPAAGPRSAEMSVRISVPGRIRRHFNEHAAAGSRPIYDGWVTVRNRTGHDLPAPLLRISADGVDAVWSGESRRDLAELGVGTPGAAEGSNGTWATTAAVRGGSVDTIAAGATVEIPFRFMATMAPDFTFYAGVWTASDASGVLDWNATVNAVIAQHGLTGAAATRFRSLLLAAVSQTERPAFAVASDSGPWATPGAYVQALNRVARAAAADGVTVLDVDARRQLLIDELLADPSLGAPVAGQVLDGGTDAPGEPLAIVASGPGGSMLTGTSRRDGAFNLWSLVGTDGTPQAVQPGDYSLFVDGRAVSTPLTITVPAAGTLSGVTVPVARGRTASGRVTSAVNGAPIAGAEVVLGPNDLATAGDLGRSGRADDAGRWRIRGLADGPHTLSIRAAGAASVAGELVTITGDAPGLDRVLVPGVRLTGVLRTPAGVPTTGTVSARNAGGGILAETDTDAAGAFTLDGLTNGPVVLVASGEGGVASETGISVAGGQDVGLGSSMSRDVRLAEPIAVTGTVVDSATGAAVPGAEVRIVPSVPGAESVTVTSGVDGSFDAAAVAPGAGTVTAVGPHGTGSTLVVDLGTAPITVSLTGTHRVTGHVVDGGGLPIAGVQVTATAPGWPSGATVTDGDGAFELAAAPGAVTVAAGRVSQVVTVPAEGPDPDVTLVAPVVALSGVVHDSLGDPAPGIGVEAVSDGAVVAVTESDDTGTYRFALVGSRPLDVWASGSTFGIAHGAVALPVSGTQTLDLDAGTAVVSVTVDGAPEGTLVQLAPADASAGAATLVSPTAGDGVATFAHLPAGNYHASAHAAGLAGAGVAVTAPGTATIVLDGGVAYPMQLTASGGGPLVGYRVFFVPTDTADEAAAGMREITDATGSATLHAQPGTYDLFASDGVGATKRLASGIVLSSGSGGGAQPAAARPALAAPQAAAPIPANQFQMGDEPGVQVFTGTVTGPNGTGFGPDGPPQVTMRIGNRRLPVDIDADGHFRLVGPPDGFGIEVAKDGFETSRQVPGWPSQASGTFEMGLPVDASPALRKPLEAPVAPPTVAELVSALFGGVEIPERGIDPMIEHIIRLSWLHGECPNATSALFEAKQQASRVVQLTNAYNVQRMEIIDRLWKERAFFAVRVLQTAATVVTATYSVAGALVTSQGRNVVDLIDLAGTKMPSELVQKLADWLTHPLTGMVTTVSLEMWSALESGNFDLAGLLLGLVKPGLDVLKEVVVWGTIKSDEALKFAGSKSILRLAAAYQVASGAYDVFMSAVQAMSDLEVGYHELRDSESRLVDTLGPQIELAQKRAFDAYARYLRERHDPNCYEPKPVPGIGGGAGAAEDPNELVGPAGTGVDHALIDPGLLGYEVHFENIGPGTENPPPGSTPATAPAADVVVTLTVPDTVDRSGFRFGDLGWGTRTVSIPGGGQEFTQSVPITVDIDGAPVGLVVEVTGTYDPTSGVATWRFHTVDPETGLLSPDPLAGFLPPEPGDGTGQGWVRYEVAARPGLSVGTAIDAQASIVFDTNPAIATNVWRNVVAAEPTVSCGATADAAKRFVCNLYQDALGREADPSGEAWWAARVDGGLSRRVIAAQFLASQEDREVVVRRTYSQLLGRSPDAAGLAYWAEQLRRGVTPDALRVLLLSSAEYSAGNGGTDAGFVAGLYDDVLGRSGSAGEVNGWTSVLSAGRSRSAVAKAILYSSEGRKSVVGELYLRFLHRPADVAGSAYWSRWLTSGRSELTIATDLAASQEYFARTD